MTDVFEKKMEAYENGTMSEEEEQAFEKELENLELLQQRLDKKQQPSLHSRDEEKKILKRGKWKARLQTAVLALSFIIIGTVVSGILTGVYYASGNPSRTDTFYNVISYTHKITDPYAFWGGGYSQGNIFFTLDIKYDMNKQIGSDIMKIGELKYKFFLSRMSYPEKTELGKTNKQRIPDFVHPGDRSRNPHSDWHQLEKLPDGTVASAYISFSELLSTEEVKKRFRGKDMELLWLAVDTGVEKDDTWMSYPPVGFPSRMPIWHEDDYIITSQTEEKTLFGSRVISGGMVSPSGDGEEDFHRQFLKTLDYLKQYTKMADQVNYWRTLGLTERRDYLEMYGIYHYGAVITGPTKKILELQDEEWISQLTVDEVALWNWEGRTY
ncbi:MAG: anti-sigma factor [Bacillota bacterium]|nr:anti-sigma factor [Bacillota bacterium]MDW7684932.1 anti-sigma factor [Bacillota bacterium]